LPPQNCPQPSYLQLISDPWLTLSDLFGDSESGVREPELSKSQPMSHLTTNSALPPVNQLGILCRTPVDSSFFPQPEGTWAKRQKTTKGKAVPVGKGIEKRSKQLSLLPKVSQSVKGESSNQPCTSFSLIQHRTGSKQRPR